MARRKFSIYLDEDLKLVLESIAKQEDRSLSKTFERACKLYADRATGKEEVTNPFPVPTREIKKKEIIEQIKEEDQPEDDIADIEF